VKCNLSIRLNRQISVFLENSALPLGDLSGFPLLVFLVKKTKSLLKEEEFARESVPSRGDRTEPHDRREDTR
jgi:hypothetical protein